MIYGSRVEQAREFRMQTQAQLAEALGILQVQVAYIETDRRQPSAEMVVEIAKVLNFQPSFFARPPSTHFGVGTLEFRARQSLTAKQKKHAHQYAHLVFELAVACSSRLKMLPMRLPSRVRGDAEEAASKVRSELGVSPNAPIENLTDVLERAGIFVFALPELVAGSLEGCDGFSVWGGAEDRLLPAIFFSALAPGDRQRMTTAHEVGELTLDGLPPGKERERLANRFAGAFLMPEEAFRRDLVPPFSLYDFVELKKRYRVSVQATIVRARHLNMIDDRRYHALFQQLSARGWRKREPDAIAIPREKPRALRKMLELLYGGEQIDFVRVADELGFDPWFLPQVLATHATKQDLRVGTTGTPSSGRVISFRRVKPTATEEALQEG